MSESRLRVAEHLRSSDFLSEGFKVRKKTPSYYIECFLITLGTLLICYVGIQYYDKLIGTYILLSSAFFVTIVGMLLKRVKTLQNSTEFLNALFSSYIGHGVRFCVLVRQDGSVIYMNRSFQTLFPGFIAENHLTLESWCKFIHIPAPEQQKLMDLVCGMPGHITLMMHTGENHSAEEITLWVEPIETPKGYTLIRAE